MQKDNNFKEEIAKQKNRGVLLILSGASGSGKDTVMHELLKKYPNMKKLVTTNTREKRPDEVDGYDYHFISREEFEKLIAKEAFFEWVEYRGHLRGGQKKHVQEAIDSGNDVIWRIDVKGVKNIHDKVKDMFPYSAFVLLLVEDLATLAKRMKARNTETQEELEWSLDMAKWEQNQYHNFDYIVTNEDGQLHNTVEKIAKIVEATRMKVITNS